MSKKPLTISESAAVQMPMKTVASLIIIVALGTMGYFQMVEKLNQHSTRLELMEKDLEENTEFRIKWPRGQLGALPADSEQFMMIEDLYKTTDKLNAHIENMALNKVNIEFLRGQMDKVLIDIEKLKDANREMKYTNGELTMIEVVVALLMFWDGEIKEHRIQESMAACLRARRIAEREFNPNVSYKCIRSEAETEIYMGEKSIKKLHLK